MAKANNTYEIALKNAINEKKMSKVKKLLKFHSSQFNDTKNDDRYYDYDLLLKALSPAQIDLAKVLIKDGFRVYKKHENKSTVLEYAVRLKDVGLVKMLLERGASVNILSTNQRNLTPLHLAIYWNQYKIVKLFLSQLDVDLIDDKHLLHFAIRFKKITAIQQLIEKGCSLNKRNEENITPLCLAIWNSFVFKRELDCILSNYTLKNITPNNYKNTAPLYIAVMCGNLEVIKKHIDSGVVPIDNRLKSNEIWPSLNDCYGLTLLHYAIKCKKVEIVEFLLNRGAHIFFRRYTKSLLLHVVFTAKQKGIWKTWQDFEDNNKIMDLLLTASTDIQCNPVDEYGISHFHVACSRDKPAIIDYYLDLGIPIDQPVEPDHPSFGGFTPLHFAAKFRCTKTLEFLLENGADVKKMNATNMTALHIAAEQSCVDTVCLLLQYGADINLIDSEGNSPLHYAFKKKNYEIIDNILSAPNVARLNLTNAEGVSHFHIACTRNNIKVVRSFIKSGVPIDDCVPIADNKSDWSGYTPLHFAVAHNKSKIVQLLLKKEADTQKKNADGLTPLHLACNYTHHTFLEFINITLRDLKKHEKIALHEKPVSDVTKVEEIYINGFDGFISNINWMANRNEHLKVIHLLLNYEADVHDIDREDNTPMFYAYSAVHKRKETLERENNYCSEHLWSQIIEHLSNELYERRKLILDIFFEQKVNLDVCYKNSSILHYICSRDDKFSEEMLELFLMKGANIDATNDENWTALHIATLNDSKNLVKILLNYNADMECIESKYDLTPLLIAAKEYYTDILIMLIHNGANANAKDSNGLTALHFLAQMFSVDYNEIAPIILSLIKAGADVNSQAFDGHTPLHVTVNSYRENYYVFDILLENGADINIKDKVGKSVGCYIDFTGLQHRLRHPDFDDEDDDDVRLIAIALREHIIKMKVIRLPVSIKLKSFYDVTEELKELILLTVEEINEDVKLLSNCKDEVKALKSKKINDNYMLYDVIFKDENALSRLVKNSSFKSIKRCESFYDLYPNYGYLIRLKYKAGRRRAKLLPRAKSALNDLAGFHVPDTCSEHIFSYFTNIELKESLKVLSSILDCNVTKSTDDNMQMRILRSTKRQRVC